MKFNEQLDRLFKDEDIANIIIGAQLLLLMERNQETVKETIVKKIKVCARSKKLQLDQLAWQQLPHVVAVVTETLHAQQELFINQLLIIGLKEYYRSLKEGSSTNLDTALSNFLDRIYKTAENFDKKFNRALITKKLQPIIKVLVEEVPVARLGEKLQQITGSSIALFSFALGIFDLLQDQSPFHPSFRITNTLIFALSLIYTFYAGNQLNQFLMKGSIQYLVRKGEPKLELHKVEFIDVEKSEEGFIYTLVNQEEALINIAPVSTVQSSNEDSKGIVQEQQPSLQKKENQKEKLAEVKMAPSIPRPVKEGPIFIWPSKSVLYGYQLNLEAISSSHELVTEMRSGRGSGLPEKRYYAFFNKRAFLQQLEEQSEEYTDYYNRWYDAHIVSSEGETGVKKLDLQYRARNIFNNKYHFFQWELKTLKKLHRGLGEEVSTVLDSNNKQHTLIDFNLHLPKGPGK